MQHHPAHQDCPEIFLFETSAELQAHLGIQNTHGLYETASKKIYATPESLAHEFAHFRDHESGRYQFPNHFKEPRLKDQARIRNEIVAVLFSWQKTANLKGLLSHEKDFLDWFHYQQDKTSGSNDKDFKSWKFREIQDYAEWVSSSSHFPKLRHIFSHYLDQRLSEPEKNESWIF